MSHLHQNPVLGAYMNAKRLVDQGEKNLRNAQESLNDKEKQDQEDLAREQLAWTRQDQTLQSEARRWRAVATGLGASANEAFRDWPRILAATKLPADLLDPNTAQLEAHRHIQDAHSTQAKREKRFIPKLLLVATIIATAITVTFPLFSGVALVINVLWLIPVAGSKRKIGTALKRVAGVALAASIIALGVAELLNLPT